MDLSWNSVTGLKYILIVALLLPTSQSLRRSEFMNQVTAQLASKYDARISPHFDAENRSTEVVCQLYVNSFDSISETTMQYSINVFFRQEWVDPRLRFAIANLSDESNHSHINLDPRMMENFWVPDTIFTNEKRANLHTVTVPNKMMRLHHDGRVLYSLRLSLRLACPMELRKFPLDTQVCAVQLESYAYPNTELTLAWMGHQPITFNEKTELPNFNLVGTEFRSCMRHYLTGNFSCIEASFILRRDFGYYVTQTYLPSILVVILSWVNFWISADAVPARITLGLLTILTVTTQFTNDNMPKVSYVKAIDVWMSTCLMFVFAALLEFAFVNVQDRLHFKRLERRAKHRRKPNGLDETEMFVTTPASERLVSTPSYPAPTVDYSSRDESHEWKRPTHAQRLDKVSRILFPVAFLVFNAGYWVTYVYVL